MAADIEPFLDKPLRELVQDSPRDIPAEEAERHRIYAGALGAIMRHYWCGNKYGFDTDYPMNPTRETWGKTCPGLANEYRGHNIAALAVDHDGYILDFEFNHNALYDSSAEHAEARLVRRLFSLSQLQDSWNLSSADNKPDIYSNALERVTVYTSLESCTQCTGIMMLGRVKEVVYLQPDPSMYRIGDLLHTLTVRKLSDPADPAPPKPDFISAPEPISAARIGLPIADELHGKLEAFLKRYDASDPFSITGGKGKPSDSITSFLCTEPALASFATLAEAFEGQVIEYPEYRPRSGSENDEQVAGKLGNAQALGEARQFVSYAAEKGHRATPHR